MRLKRLTSMWFVALALLLAGGPRTLGLEWDPRGRGVDSPVRHPAQVTLIRHQ